MGNSLYARDRPCISPTHKGPVVNLVGWVLMVTSVLAVLTVLVSKLIVVRKLGPIDAILTCALVCSVQQWSFREHLLTMLQVFGIAYIGAVTAQVSHGLGSPVHTISHASYVLFQKAGYSSFFLYIMAISTSKMTTLYLLHTLTPQRSHRRPILTVGGFILVWAVGTLLASAFQCSLPTPYLYTSNSQCISQTGFWYATGVIDILTDAALMALPVMVIAKLQLPMHKKLTIGFAFSFRLAPIGCTIFRMAEVRIALHRSQHYDPTFNNWLFTLATELEIFCGILATAVPHLRPFIESIQGGYLTGMIGDSAEPRTGYGSQGAADSYVMRKMGDRTGNKSRGDDYALGTKNSVMSYVRGGAAAKRQSRSMELPRQGARSDNYINEKNGRGQIGQAISTSEVAEHSNERRSDSRMSDGGRSGGSDGSKAMIIKTTQEWSVQYENEGRG